MGTCANDLLPGLVGIDDGSGEVVLDGSAWRFGGVIAEETDTGRMEHEMADGAGHVRRHFTRRMWILRGSGPVPHIFGSFDIGVDVWICRFPDPAIGGGEVIVETLPALARDTSDRMSGVQTWALRLVEKDGIAFGVTPPEPEPGCSVEDQFLAIDGTSVQDHTPETGGPWVTESALGPEWPKIASNRAYSLAGELESAASVSPSEDDYILRGRFVVGPSSGAARLAGRWDGVVAGVRESVVILSFGGQVFGFLEPFGSQVPMGSFVAAGGDSVDVEMTLAGGTLSATVTHSADPGRTISASTNAGGATGTRAGFLLTSATENPGFELDEISICPE